MCKFSFISVEKVQKIFFKNKIFSILNGSGKKSKYYFTFQRSNVFLHKHHRTNHLKVTYHPTHVQTTTPVPPPVRTCWQHQWPLSRQHHDQSWDHHSAGEHNKRLCISLRCEHFKIKSSTGSVVAQNYSLLERETAVSAPLRLQMVRRAVAGVSQKKHISCPWRSSNDWRSNEYRF